MYKTASGNLNPLLQCLRQGCFAAFLLAYSACAAAAAEPLDAIIAVVNDDIVMASEINRMFERVKAELQQQRADAPPDAALRRQVLERLIVMKIQLQLAAQTGLKVDDDTLNRAVSNIASENGMPLARFREAVERDGYDFAQFREDVRHEIIISRLRQREVSNLVHVSDREIDNYLATQVQQDTIEMEYRLAHILVATPEAASEEDAEKARKKAEKLLRRVRAGEDFLRMAAKNSGDPQALDSGDLGWRKAGEVPTVFSEAVTSLREGEVSDVIGSPSGYHIIKVLGVRSGEEMTVKQTRARHILIKPSELMSSDDVLERLHKLKERIDAGDDFDDLARSHSEDKATAAKGGDLGWVSPGDLAPKFDEVMDLLSPDGISDPFETEFGWHIVQVLQRRDHDNTREALRGKARDAIRQRKIEETGQAWLRRLRDEAYVEYRFRE
ncbi:MAG: peptidylprolyl isomerase [Pseudomonadota bacterium]|nr:peptidylprolyl isomerase [Pseudomonadota bacterium]